MWPILGGLITGGASLLGSMFSSDTSAQNTQANIAGQLGAQRESESFNREEAAKNRTFNAGQAQNAMNFSAQQVTQQEAFQEHMSNTSFQRSREDATKAGLNPMVLAGMGGASTPSGSAASGVSASGSAASVGMPNMAVSNRTSPFAGLGDAVSKGIDAMVSAKTVDRMTEEIANLKATQNRQIAETASEQKRPAQIEQATRESGARTEDLKASASGRRQEQVIRTPSQMEAQGIADTFSAKAAGKVGAIKYVTGAIGDILAPLVNTATGAGRVSNAFRAMRGEPWVRYRD